MLTVLTRRKDALGICHKQTNKELEGFRASNNCEKLTADFGSIDTLHELRAAAKQLKGDSAEELKVATESLNKRLGPTKTLIAATKRQCEL
eukprot:1853620-Alexandrium_andersonii.AAC.1